MDRIYHEIYARLYEEYTEGIGRNRIPVLTRLTEIEMRDALKTITGAIDQYVEANDGFRIRADAKYFLVVNFFQVVLLPIFAARDSIDRDQLLEDVDSDIKLILSEAPQKRTSEEDEGVTSHGIVWSINNAWDRLRVTDSLHWMK